MKNKLLLVLFFFICIYSVGVVHALSLPLLGKVIYLDPGHGGEDPGAVYSGVLEEDINLEITLRLRDVLEKNGAIVYLTRDDDYDLSVKNTNNRKRSDLSQRVNIINDSNSDIYLSIHLNADSSGNWSGPQVFYADNLEDNKTIAKELQLLLNTELNTKRNYKTINDAYMYQRINVPGVLVEVGFISNKVELSKLKTDNYQLKVANILKDYLIQYFN